MAVAGEQILTRLGFEVDGISLKSSLEKAAAFGSALRRAFADASAAFVGVAKGEAEVAAQADALGVSVERFAEWRFIAEQTGASSDALGASLKAMLANNPGLSDAASELERAGGAMREMGDAQREAYARGLGIDPSLIPMLTRDVSGLRDMFRSLYATAGTDAAKAAEDGKGFLDGMARLAGLCDLLAKTVALSLLGTARSGIEALGDAFVAHFDDIRRVLELVVALASAAAPAIGAALGNRAQNRPSRVYVAVGDGECDEGQIWEGAQFAAHYKLDNLVCLVDNNGRQLDGAVADVMSHGKGIGAKFDAFGWNVIDVADGNDVEQIYNALEQAKACKGKPTCLILNTVKGKGATFAEPSGAHSSQPTKEQWDEAIAASEAALTAVKNEK